MFGAAALALNLKLSFPVSRMWQWWVSLSSRAVVILASPNTLAHSLKLAARAIRPGDFGGQHLAGLFGQGADSGKKALDLGHLVSNGLRGGTGWRPAWVVQVPTRERRR